jgi:excisionase family DNA binding protein
MRHMSTPKPTMTRPQLIGAKPASGEYGIKYTSLRDLVHRGELPCIRIGRAMYFDRSDIEHWIERSKTSTWAPDARFQRIQKKA